MLDTREFYYLTILYRKPMGLYNVDGRCCCCCCCEHTKLRPGPNCDSDFCRSQAVMFYVGRPVNSASGNAHPSTRPVLTVTGHPSTRPLTWAVNSGSRNRALVFSCRLKLSAMTIARHCHKMLFRTFMAKIKCVKVRALFAKNKVRFARAEQLCYSLEP